MNETTLYEMGETNGKDCLDHSVRGLSQKEQMLKETLSKIEGETLVAISIQERLSSGSIADFREMISELKQQYNDCGRERMIVVFGVEAVKLFEAL